MKAILAPTWFPEIESLFLRINVHDMLVIAVDQFRISPESINALRENNMNVWSKRL